MKADAQLLQDVQDELAWEPVLHKAQIDVSIHDGKVNLSGQVNSLAEKEMAGKAAKRVQGVKAVIEQLQVLPAADQPSDQEITHAVEHLFRWHCHIPEKAIRVGVQNGLVTLEGLVEEQFQKHAAGKAVSYLLGVRGVENLISVKPRKAVTPRAAILEALQRNAVLEAQRINVEVDGSRVMLNGWVNSWMEHRAIEKIVWATPGVTSLQDDMVVAN